MTFIAPWWLLGLLPWGAVTAWLLWGRRKKVDVPFIALWQGPTDERRTRRSWQLPPIALAAAIVAIGLGVMAASRPVLRTREGGGMPTRIIIDRGVSMSARDGARLRDLVDEAADVIARELGDGPVELTCVPGGENRTTDRAGWSALAKTWPATALQTRGLLSAAVAQLRQESDVPIIVLSDQPVANAHERVIRIAPDRPVQNVGIVRLSARQTPAGQVMVRLRNQSARSQAVLRVLLDAKEASRQKIELPGAGGGERDYFVDLANPGRLIEVTIEVEDDLTADNRAALVRERRWPAIEPRFGLPAGMARMVESYERLRPADEQSKRVAIVRAGDGAPINEPAVLVATGAVGGAVGGTGGVASEDGEMTVAEHPVTRAVKKWPAGLARSAPPAEAGWVPLVRGPAGVMVAARSEPVRQMWVGMDLDRWAISSDFVIFWTNVFDWLGSGGERGGAGAGAEGDEEYVGYPIGQLAEEWSAADVARMPAGVEAGLWPGVYRRSDGALRAVNALDVKLDENPGAAGGANGFASGAADWRAALRRLSDEEGRWKRGHDIAGWILLAALAMMALAAATWRKVATVPSGGAVVRSHAGPATLSLRADGTSVTHREHPTRRP